MRTRIAFHIYIYIYIYIYIVELTEALKLNCYTKGRTKGFYLKFDSLNYKSLFDRQIWIILFIIFWNICK